MLQLPLRTTTDEARSLNPESFRSKRCRAAERATTVVVILVQHDFGGREPAPPAPGSPARSKNRSISPSVGEDRRPAAAAGRRGDPELARPQPWPRPQDLNAGPTGTGTATVGRLRRRNGWRRGGRGLRRLDLRAGCQPSTNSKHKESDDVSDRHASHGAARAHRPGLRIHVGERHARRRAEPDHRTAEADRIGEEAPVVTALFQRQRGQWNVVEHRRHKTQAQRGLPGRDRQSSPPASSTHTGPATTERRCP